MEKIENLPGDIRPPRMLVLLDEFTSLLTPDVVPTGSDDLEFNDERVFVLAGNRLQSIIATFTAKITREARSAGVTFVLATQKLTADDLKKLPGGSTLKVNLSRIIAGKATWGELAAALKRPQAAPELGEEPPPGRAIFESTKGSPVLIQGWWAPGGQKELAGELNTRIEPLHPSDRLDLDRFQMAHESSAETDPERLPPAFGGEIDLGQFELDLTDSVDETAVEQASQIDWESLTIAANDSQIPEDSPEELSWDTDEVSIIDESALEDEGSWLTSPRPKIKIKMKIPSRVWSSTNENRRPPSTASRHLSCDQAGPRSHHNRGRNRVVLMMGGDHAACGAAAWIALTSSATVEIPLAQVGTWTLPLGFGILDVGPIGVVTGAFMCAGAALLPDADHPNATIAHSLPPVSTVIVNGVGKVSGGHRHGTHSVLGIVAAIILAWAAQFLTPANVLSWIGQPPADTWWASLQVGPALMSMILVGFALTTLKFVPIDSNDWPGCWLAPQRRSWFSLHPNNLTGSPWSSASGSRSTSSATCSQSVAAISCGRRSFGPLRFSPSYR